MNRLTKIIVAVSLFTSLGLTGLAKNVDARSSSHTVDSGSQPHGVYHAKRHKRHHKRHHARIYQTTQNSRHGMKMVRTKKLVSH